MHIVTLEDDPMVQSVIEAAIGSRARHFSDGAQLLAEADDLAPLAFFVDIHLSEQASGLEVIPRLRERWPFVPIIVVTSDQADEMVGEALASGADDFVRKPLRPKELVARLQARASEQARYQARALRSVGDVTLDLLHNTLTGAHGESRALSQTDMALLCCLADAKGTVVPRRDLKLRCWGSVKVSDKAVDRKIHLVRAALSDVTTAVQVTSIYGAGFRLDVRGAAQEPHEARYH
jgi:DNA-binding response OmpR family regulator